MLGIKLNQVRKRDHWFQGSFSAPLTYQSFAGDRTFNIDDVYKVVQLATSCEYHLTVECHKVDMDDVWLVPYNTSVPSVLYHQTAGTFCISDDNGQFALIHYKFKLVCMINRKMCLHFLSFFNDCGGWGSWSLRSWEEGTRLTDTINNVVTNGLARQGNKASAAIVLAEFSRSILVVTP